jgi:conjugative transposon TraM protein
MKHKTESPKTLRQRKLLVVLPMLALPFVTLLFWALGGGKADNTPKETTAQNGFNLRLPDARLSDETSLDKLSYYDQAQADSAKFEQLRRNDPYYQSDTGKPVAANPSAIAYQPVSGRSSKPSYQTGIGPSRHDNYQDPNEAKVYRKIAQLNTLLEKADTRQSTNTDAPELASGFRNALPSDLTGNADIERLQQMMQAMDRAGGEDPEMRQINGMLEKILDIQHPERVDEKTKRVSKQNQGQVLPVVSADDGTSVSLLENQPLFPRQTDSVGSYSMARATNGFHTLEETATDMPNAIEAVIHQTQALRSGSTVKLRLTTGIYISGVLIPKDHFLYGTASLNGERLQVEIKGIRYGNSLFPVELSVHDTDGLLGIYIPGALTRDAAKQSAGGLVQGMNLGTPDASLGAQAVGAGIEAAKSLLGKRARLVQVTVQAGHQVLLRDGKQKQNP